MSSSTTTTDEIIPKTSYELLDYIKRPQTEEEYNLLKKGLIEKLSTTITDEEVSKIKKIFGIHKTTKIRVMETSFTFSEELVYIMCPPEGNHLPIEVDIYSQSDSWKNIPFG